MGAKRKTGDRRRYKQAARAQHQFAKGLLRQSGRPSQGQSQFPHRPGADRRQRDADAPSWTHRDGQRRRSGDVEADPGGAERRFSCYPGLPRSLRAPGLRQRGRRQRRGPRPNPPQPRLHPRTDLATLARYRDMVVRQAAAEGSLEQCLWRCASRSWSTDDRDDDHAEADGERIPMPCRRALTMHEHPICEWEVLAGAAALGVVVLHRERLCRT